MNRLACIFDIDGTLANIAHRVHHIEKSPADWDAFYSALSADEPQSDIIELSLILGNAGYAIILCTGREETHMRETVSWLHKNHVIFDKLYMRATGDRRGDNVIKIEMLALIRSDGFDPVMAFEDRNIVVKAWRKVGLRCLQVADGDF